ncbi:MAG TPA: hypothetical protein VLG76_01810 [Rhabdochlamydiaceae bacterium]|nr:hypothetical protein [Rhabdochlamydiaceae bacterium]
MLPVVVHPLYKGYTTINPPNTLVNKPICLVQSKLNQPNQQNTTCRALVGRTQLPKEAKPLPDQLTDAVLAKELDQLLEHFQRYETKISNPWFFIDGLGWQKINLFIDEMFLISSITNLFDKANALQKFTIVARLCKEGHIFLLRTLPINEKLAIKLLQGFMGMPDPARRVKNFQEVLTYFFEKLSYSGRMQILGSIRFTKIYSHLDKEIIAQIIGQAITHGNIKAILNYLEDKEAASEAFLHLISKWQKYEKYEGSNELLELILQNIKLGVFTGKIARDAEQYLEKNEDIEINVDIPKDKREIKNCVHLAIQGISIPSLRGHLFKVLPNIKDHGGLILMACEHGDLNLVQALMQRTKAAQLPMECVTHSARFGHIHVVQYLLGQSHIKFFCDSYEMPHKNLPILALDEAAKEDDGDMVFALLEWIHQRESSVLLLSSVIFVLMQTAVNRKDRYISMSSERQALQAIGNFCKSVGLYLSDEFLKKARDAAECEAADPYTAHLLDNEIRNLHLQVPNY